MIDLNFLIAAFISQIFSPTSELAIHTGTPTIEGIAEIETQALKQKQKQKQNPENDQDNLKP